jgi:hypothetical protein
VETKSRPVMFIRIRNTFPEVSGQFFFDCPVQKPINWIPLSQVTTQSQRALENLKENDVLFLHDISPGLANQNIVMLVTKGYSACLEGYYSQSSIKIIEIDELTDVSGCTVKMLDEPEINDILRIVFGLRSPKVYISLLNSLRNARQEQILRNILLPPGYSCELASKYLDNFKL